MKRVLVTGASGFVGRELCTVLSRGGHAVRAALRQDHGAPLDIAERVVIGEIGAHTEWSAALKGIDSVVHLAARAHIMGATRAGTDLYFEVNTSGTARLARAALAAGVQRFVFLSSIKVNGEETAASTPYRATDTPRPQDPYGMSKWSAEKDLLEIGSAAPMAIAIVRAPLVYGPGVRANFLRLMRWVDQEKPLPFGAISNRRSLVSLWNLCDLLRCLLEHPGDVRGTWLVSDGEDVSTPELIRRLARAMGRKDRLFPVPVWLLERVGALLQRRAEIKRLCGSLAVDSSATCFGLGWTPVLSMNEALSRTAQWYQNESGSRQLEIE